LPPETDEVSELKFQCFYYSFACHEMTCIRYDTIEEINVDSKAEYTA